MTKGIRGPSTWTRVRREQGTVSQELLSEDSGRALRGLPVERQEPSAEKRATHPTDHRGSVFGEELGISRNRTAT